MSDSNESSMIPLSEPEISGNEWKYIKDCLDTGWVSSVGEYVTRFEQLMALYVGTEYAVATVNGTAALHISLVACGVRPGDEVIIPALTFIAPANTVRYCNAQPVFIDCDADTLCLDVGKLAGFLAAECEQRKDGFTYNRITGSRIKAVLPVHVFGHPVDMDSLIELCRRGNIEIIEDATESLGSEYKGRKTGSFGKTGCFSFNGNKIITTGGGGMVVTGEADIAKRIRHLTTQAKSDPFEYDHDEIGYNYRLTNIHSAMGVAQMERLGEFIKIKKRNAWAYRELLSDISEVEFLWEKPWAKSNFWFYTIRVAKRHKRPLMDFLLEKGIRARPVWKIIPSLPMYRKCQSYAVENAVDAYERCLNLPCSVGMSEENVKAVVGSVRDYFERG